MLWAAEVALGIGTMLLAHRIDMLERRAAFSATGLNTHFEMYICADFVIGITICISMAVYGFRSAKITKWKNLRGALIGFVPFFMGLMIGNLFMSA